MSILAHRENYGYAIIQAVREASGGNIEWSEGMLYPVLHRLEKGEAHPIRMEKDRIRSAAKVLSIEAPREKSR